MSNTPDQSAFIETLLHERDELYQELSKLRQADGGTLERYDALIREKDSQISQLDDKVRRSDEKIQKFEEKIQKFEEKIKQLTDQLAWLRRNKVLPSFRPLINKYKFSYYDDVIQCYITGNNSQSYSGY